MSIIIIITITMTIISFSFLKNPNITWLNSSSIRSSLSTISSACSSKPLTWRQFSKENIFLYKWVSYLAINHLPVFLQQDMTWRSGLRLGLIKNAQQIVTI